jgi:hypothetical protein
MSNAQLSMIAPRVRSAAHDEHADDRHVAGEFCDRHRKLRVWDAK